MSARPTARSLVLHGLTAFSLCCCDKQLAAALEGMDLAWDALPVSTAAHLFRGIPTRMEGDPTARIVPWQSERFENPHTHPKEAPAHDNSSSSSSSSPHVKSTGRSGEDSGAPGEGTEQGLRETSQPSAEWGDVGDFSMGALELGAFSSAKEQGHDPELQQEQQRHSHR